MLLRPRWTRNKALMSVQLIGSLTTSNLKDKTSLVRHQAKLNLEPISLGLMICSLCRILSLLMNTQNKRKTAENLYFPGLKQLSDLGTAIWGFYLSIALLQTTLYKVYCHELR